MDGGAGDVKAGGGNLPPGAGPPRGREGCRL